MKPTVIFLIGVLFFICWSLYNVSEGFQTENTAAPEETKCVILKGAYQTLQSTLDNAVKNDNTQIITTFKPSMESLKTALTNAGC